MAEDLLVALEQADFSLARLPLSGVLLPDGQTGLLHTSLCEGLDLHPHKQARKILTHPTLSASLVRVQVKMESGMRTVNVLLSWGIPMWLGSIQLGGRPPAYRRRVEMLQRDVNAALARLFRDKLTELNVHPSPADLPPGAPTTTQVPEQAHHPRRPTRTRASQQRSSAPSREGVSAQVEKRIQVAVQAMKAEVVQAVQAELRAFQQEQQAREAQREARLAAVEDASQNAAHTAPLEGVVG